MCHFIAQVEFFFQSNFRYCWVYSCLIGFLIKAGMMQLRKAKKISVESPGADRFLNVLISVLMLFVFVGMGLLLHISLLSAHPHDTEATVAEDPRSWHRDS